jgi:hypothetical protein
MVVLENGLRRDTSRAAEQCDTTPVEHCYHADCFTRARKEKLQSSPDL